MKIIYADGKQFHIDEDRLQALGPIRLQISIGVPGTGIFSKPFHATFDPGATGCPSVVMPLVLLKQLGLDKQLALTAVADAEMADGSVEREYQTLISLRLTTIPHGNAITFDGIKCGISEGAKADGALIGLSALRYFHVVLREADIYLLTPTTNLPVG